MAGSYVNFKNLPTFVLIAPADDMWVNQFKCLGCF